MRLGSMWLRRQSFRITDIHFSNEDTVPLKKTSSSALKVFLMGALSGVFFSSAAVFVKLLKSLDPAQLAMYRLAGTFVFGFPVLVKGRRGMFEQKNARFSLFISSLCGSTGVYLSYVAFQYLPLGEAMIIIFCSPVVISVVACLYLKEPCGISQSVAGVLVLLGVVFISKLPTFFIGTPFTFTKEFIYGVVSAICAVFFLTGQVVSIRKITYVNHAVVTMNLAAVGIVETAMLTIFVGHFRWHGCGIEGLYIILIGLLSYLSSSLLIQAVLCDSVGPITVLRAGIEIFLSFMYQILIFRDIPDTYSIIGASLVGVSFILSAVIKWVASLPIDSKKIRYFKWILR